MSELKEHLFVPYSELQEGAELTDDFTIAKSYYDKSEADKVIAELKDRLQNVSEILKETRGWLMESQKLHKRCADNATKMVRHSNHKRCLAMAWWCSAELGMLVSTWESKIKHYKKWQLRWLELAEKFKEA